MLAHKNSILILLIFIVSCCESKEDLPEITIDKFEKLVQDGKITKLVLVKNLMFVEVFLAADSYEQEIKLYSFDKGRTGPHLKIKIEQIDQFINFYEDFSKKTPLDKRIDLHFEERSESPKDISSWPPLLILILILFTLFILFQLIQNKREKNKIEVNVANQLEKLAKLKDQGILTEEEFTSQKKKLL